MSKFEPPFYPIIYVRGYAGNDAEIEDTVADPYMGFNLGSTKLRQTWSGAVRRRYFESPLFRLVKDFGYIDVYSDGRHMPGEGEIPSKCVVIYRYYDEQFFDDLTDRPTDMSRIEGERREIEAFADGLSELILKLRNRVCTDDMQARKEFRVYLVAHSMGGLVCRCFLQNPKVGTETAKKLVDKVFTYATPHNGIDFKVFGNVPNFFSRNNVNNFNRARMREYLALPKRAQDVSNLKGRFDPDRFFCLVGTNSRDYEVAAGWSRRVTGPMSDGLVRIVNATVYDQKTAKSVKRQAPRAFVHRSHSGHFGIVNSEEGYQNLTRFFFGNVRVDGILELSEITLPPDVEKEKIDGGVIKASYQFETVVRVRGYDWDLHRRTIQEESAIFRTYNQIFPLRGKPRSPHLFSVYLSNKARVLENRPSLGFAVDLRVQVPEYEIDGFLWRNRYYNGSYLFRDTITLEATPPRKNEDAESFKVRYGLDSRSPNRVTKTADLKTLQGELAWEIPLDSKTVPGLKGALKLKASAWK